MLASTTEPWTKTGCSTGSTFRYQRREPETTLLQRIVREHLALRSKQHVGPSMEGVVLKGDVLPSIEGGGRFKILNGTLSLGLLSSYWPQIKNHASRINARLF